MVTELRTRVFLYKSACNGKPGFLRSKVVYNMSTQLLPRSYNSTLPTRLLSPELLQV